MPDWLKKVWGYAPDIAAAVATGGSSLAVTGLRILGKEFLGNEDATEEQVKTAVEAATPAQLLPLTKLNNEFKLEAMKIEAAEMESARSMYKNTMHAQADKIADNVMMYNVMYVIAIALAQIIAITAFALPASAVVIIGNVCGWIIKGLLDERLQVCNFYFGSSIGSKVKDKGEDK